MIMLRKILSPLPIIMFLSAIALGQDGPPNPPPNDERPNVLAQLGLSQDQIQQFRRTNAEHRPLMEAAQKRLREANRELDIVIYADTISEEAFHAKLKAFQEAQGEVTQLRFRNELSIRKILTPEQLTLFREIRRRFANARDFIQDRTDRRRRQIQDRMQRRNPNDLLKTPQNNIQRPAKRGT